jgi:hypothetical protein
MKRLEMVVLLGTVALLGNLIVDWVSHKKPELVELVGAAIVGMVLALGFRIGKSKS